MNHRHHARARQCWTCAQILAASALGLLAIQGCGRAQAQEAAPADSGQSRDNINLTVYKEDFGVVQENRPVELTSGVSKIQLTDVSKTLDQESVIFNLPKGGGAKVDANTYDLGIQESGSLLKRFLGKQVDLVRFGQDGKESERIHGVLQVAEPGNVVLYSDGKYLINPTGNIEASAKQSIAAIPQLSVQISSPSSQKADLGMTYLTRGLSWSADYVATLPPKSDTMKLECWATVTNTTGVDYPNAHLALVAGSPNRAARDRSQLEYMTTGTTSLDEGVAKSPTNQPKPFAMPSPAATGELYSYPVKEPSTISQQQMNRVRMLSSDEVKIDKDYNLRLDPYTGPDAHTNATLAIRFRNTDKDGLGLPLPGGAVRLYEPNDAGAMTYVGADTLRDTPKEMGAYLTLTNVFDVWAESKAAKVKRVDKRTVQRDFEVKLHNSKTEDITLRVVRGFEGKFKIVSESEPSTRPDAYSAQWKVKIPAGKDTILKFSVQSSY